MRQLNVIALILGLFCVIEAQAQGVDIGGPLFECRPAWVFAAGSVQAHFSKGQLTGVVSEPPRFEVSPYCGGSDLTISLSAFVKNVSMRVSAGSSGVRVLGSPITVNPGGSGTIVTIAGPTSSLYLWSVGEGSIRVDRISFELAEQPALFSFGATTTGRVLTHKYRDDDAYPSAKQTEDAKILVEGLVHDLTGTNGIGGRKVYFRLIDPADTADYTKKNGDAKPGDNADGPGTLSTASAMSDSNGKVSVTLGITDHAAGDNYQIEAALDPEFKCAPAPCQKSIVYTAWKRVYVEVNKMFRVGSFIIKPVVPGDKKIVVESVEGFPQPPFTVRLIHAANVEDLAPDFYFEDVRIIAKRPIKDAGTELVMEGADDSAVAGVVNAYRAEEKVRNIIRPYLRDAVGVTTGDRNRDYFLTNGTFVNRTFEDAFVEHLWLTDSVAGTDKDLLATQPRMAFDGAIPFRATRIGDSGDSEREWLTRKWLRNATRTTTEERSAKPNHQALFIAAKHQFSDTKKSLWSIGITTVADDFNDAWVFVEETGMGNNNFRGEATVHELAHQWLVNPTTSKGTPASGHCDTALPDPYQLMYNQHSLKCTMTSDVSKPSNQEASDGIVGFHYNVKVGQPRDSEYLRIRRRAEPVPQNEKTGRILK